MHLPSPNAPWRLAIGFLIWPEHSEIPLWAIGLRVLESHVIPGGFFSGARRRKCSPCACAILFNLQFIFLFSAICSNVFQPVSVIFLGSHRWRQKSETTQGQAQAEPLCDGAPDAAAPASSLNFLGIDFAFCRRRGLNFHILGMRCFAASVSNSSIQSLKNVEDQTPMPFPFSFCRDLEGL